MRVRDGLVRSILNALLVVTRRGRAVTAYRDAKRLTREGKYQEALEKHIWFHDHAAKYTPMLGGVRLSYALADWVELGKKYPPALTALRDIRDKKTARLLEGSAKRKLFFDVVSINEYLREPGATVGLFAALDAAHPEFAAEVNDVAERALVDAGEFALARKYLGDPMRGFERARSNLTDGTWCANVMPNAGDTRQTFEELFSRDIVRLLTILDRTGDRDVAREIQGRALEVLDDPAIRGALGE